MKEELPNRRSLLREYFLDVEGSKVHYFEGGEGESLVLVHGWLGSSVGFKHVMPDLVGHYHVIAPDLPGFGETEELKGKHTIETYVDFLRGFIEKKRLTKISLVGVSFGGAVCLRFAQKYPMYLEKLVL